MALCADIDEDGNSGNEIDLLLDPDAGSEVVTAEMASVDTVTIESSPAPVDESLRRILVPSKSDGLETPYQCEICSKTFSTTASLTSHRWQHTKLFQYEHCRHLAVHLDKRAHLCDLCGRSFRRKTQLRLHAQRHTGIKNFNCVHCESKFLTKGDLERHVKSHLGARDFSCQLCNKPFIRQKTLNEHMKRHHGLRPYECKTCGKSFSEMSTVWKHLRSHGKGKHSLSEDMILRLTVGSADYYHTHSCNKGNGLVNSHTTSLIYLYCGWIFISIFFLLHSMHQDSHKTFVRLVIFSINLFPAAPSQTSHINNYSFSEMDCSNWGPGCRKQQTAWEPSVRGSKVHAKFNGHDKSDSLPHLGSALPTDLYQSHHGWKHVKIMLSPFYKLNVLEDKILAANRSLHSNACFTWSRICLEESYLPGNLVPGSRTFCSQVFVSK